MRFIYDDGAAETELELRVGRPDATVADLAAALRGAGARVTVDGRLTAPEAVLTESGLVLGSRVRPVDVGSPILRKPVVVLQIVGGLDAGRAVPLTAGRTVIGRGADADVRVVASGVSRTHCVLDVAPDATVRVSDLGSGNGTDVNDVRLSGPVVVGPRDLISLGGEILVRVVPPELLGKVQHINAVREVRPGGTLPFNRQPRIPTPSLSTPILTPSAPKRAHKQPFGVAELVGPLVLAGATVWIMGDVRYAAIALLTPLMFFGNFVEDRMRGRFSFRRGVREFRARMAAFAVTLEAHREAELRTRRAACPNPAEVAARATGPSPNLWERRRSAPDFLKVSVGLADLPWRPEIACDQDSPAPEAVALLEKSAVLPRVPVVVDIGAGGVVGLEGDRRAALAAARSLLVQGVVGSGPADVTVAVFTDADRLADWDWTKWLPHGADRRSGSARLTAVGRDQSDALARGLLAAEAAHGDSKDRPVLLVIVDGADLLEGRPCPLRDLLATSSVSCGGIVITRRLPALCTAIVTVTPEGKGSLRDVTTGEETLDVLIAGVADDQARTVSRALARYEDPELRVEGAGLPDRLNLLPLLGLASVTGEEVAAHWSQRVAALRVQAVLGVTERDLFTIDLDDDGPHGLIAGTTGSGKSELLRTLIASMAVDADPEHLTFALVDYKGGGALDECARLPHVVGLVTDLDEQLSERALRCLEAEVHHRERLLRDAGLSHVRDYQRLRDRERPDLEPMPRLVVVIDEFATLVKALPDFVDALVSVAQRGRSLGVHLIMATQRPSGSVSDAIKNNVKLRIALRLESTSDSDDVIDNPAAAGIGSRQWGRGYYRLSAREVLPVQTALSTGITPAAAVTAPVILAPFRLGVAVHESMTTDEDAPTDLQRLVAAAREAAALAGFAEPRRPWPDPLPSVVPMNGLPQTAARGLHSQTPRLPAFALADDPDRQTQYAVGWDPGEGNLLIYGAVGAGTSTALAALALSIARTRSPDSHHIFAIDLGAGDLAPLAALPHTGAHIGAAEKERQIRLIRLLRKELDSRKATGYQGDTPQWLVLVDNFGALAADFDKDAGRTSLFEDLTRVFADGPAVGIRFAMTADRVGAVYSAWSSLARQKLVMRMADPNEYGSFDVPRSAVPGYVPGRALVPATRQVIQIAWPGEDWDEAVAEVAHRWSGAAATAPHIGSLPQEVAAADLGSPASTGPEPWRIPLGIGAETLGPVGLTLYEHEHALIAGPQRSGRSTALCTVVQATLSSANPPAIIAVALRRSPLRAVTGLTALVTDYADLAAALAGATGDTLLVVDDAETVEDELGILDRWIAEARSGQHLIAAGRAEGLRRVYAHWTQKVRESRAGVLLVPDYDLDGELLGAVLPRHDRMAPIPGRGFLVVEGETTGIQLARIP
ncbi:S-DNA-T family DNA segregation ATPase FtsK/SpoIIIE [Catenulispora sp. GAS73]|uniref:FtsK/SpoIIIE domain-containing protein n=1 Tax=Catenulispora sp. GAS73 TaxID=3156269 RepID=UPI0035131CF7